MLKSFDKIEKELITRLVKEKEGGQAVQLGNVLDTFFQNTYIKIDKTQNSVEIMYAHADQTSQIIQDQSRVASIILLLNYLEKNGFISLFNCANYSTPTSTIGQGAHNTCTISYSFPDQSISSWLLNNCDKQIVVSYDLVELVKDNFISKDELRFRKQQKITWISIIVSFLIGLSGIIMNLLPSCCCQ